MTAHPAVASERSSFRVAWPGLAAGPIHRLGEDSLSESPLQRWTYGLLFLVHLLPTGLFLSEAWFCRLVRLLDDYADMESASRPGVRGFAHHGPHQDDDICLPIFHGYVHLPPILCWCSWTTPSRQRLCEYCIPGAFFRVVCFLRSLRWPTWPGGSSRAPHDRETALPFMVSHLNRRRVRCTLWLGLLLPLR